MTTSRKDGNPESDFSRKSASLIIVVLHHPFILFNQTLKWSVGYPPTTNHTKKANSQPLGN